MDSRTFNAKNGSLPCFFLLSFCIFAMTANMIEVPALSIIDRKSAPTTLVAATFRS